MKFSEIDQANWDEQKHYFDTCVIPLSGLIGTESPTEAVEKLSKLQSLIDQLESNFRGRIVVYPAHHYVNEQTVETVDAAIQNLKESNYKYVVLLSGQLNRANVPKTKADFILNADNLQEIVSIWQARD